MKIQNLLLSTLFAFQFVNATTEKIFNYKFHCVNTPKNSCSTLHKEFVDATNSLSEILDISSKVNFEVFVDDTSKYRVDKTKDSVAISLNNDFAPLNPKNININIPDTKINTLKSKLSLKTDRDFIFILNNFKSDKNYLKNLKDDKTTLISIEIFEALFNLEKLPYPYNERGIDKAIFDSINIDQNEMAKATLNVRHDLSTIENIALKNEDKNKKFIEANKLPETIHWKDTLISKGKENFSRGKYDYKRIVAIGDVHGDFKKLESVLRQAELIDEENNWIGTDSILVQVGDLTDRGSEFKEIIELLMKLRQQANEKGGIVYVLLGNHELYDMQAGYFVVPKSDFDKFGGIVEREKAISMDGKYGKFLRSEMNITMIVDDNLFVHAGLTPKFAKMGIDEINKHAHDILSNVPSFDTLLNDYYQQNKTHPLYADPLFDMNDGPLWTRYYMDTPEEQLCGELEKVLETTKAKRMIIGHNVQEFGKINTKCQSKLILIDVGLSNCIGNYYGYVEILNDKKEIWARYKKPGFLEKLFKLYHE